MRTQHHKQTDPRRAATAPNEPGAGADGNGRGSALKALIDSGPVDETLIVKLVILSQCPEPKAILDALARADLHRVRDVSCRIVELLEAVAADRPLAAE